MATAPQSRAASLAEKTIADAQRMLAGSPLIRTALMILAILHAVYQLGHWLPKVWSRTDHDRGDLLVYFDTAQRAFHHTPIYQQWPHLGPDVTPAAYLYPPQFAALLYPLGSLNFHDFCIVWYSIVVLGFWGFAWSLDRLSAGRSSLLGTLCWGLVLAMTPTVYTSLTIGQADSLMWALFGLSLATRFRGTFLSLTAQVKPYGFLVAALAGVREGRLVLGPMIATTLIGCALGAAVFGLGSFVDWIKWSVPLNSQGRFNPGNVSITFAVLRALHGLEIWSYPGGPLAPGPRLFLGASGLIALAVSIYSTRKMEPRVAYVIVLMTAFLFSPTCWSTYLPTLWLLAALWLGSRHAESKTGEED